MFVKYNTVQVLRWRPRSYREMTRVGIPWCAPRTRTLAGVGFWCCFCMCLQRYSLLLIGRKLLSKT